MLRSSDTGSVESNEINKIEPSDSEFESLPRDVLIMIALELDLPELFSFCLTSKRFNDIACSNQNFWRSRLVKNKHLLGKQDITDIGDPKNYYQDRVEQFKRYLSEKLFEFARKGNLNMVKKTVEKGARLNNTYPFGDEWFTPLQIASFMGRMNVVQYLVETGKIHQYDLDKALVQALKGIFYNRRNDIAVYLVMNGANPSYDDGWAIDIVRHRKDEHMVKFLEKNQTEQHRR